MQTESAQGPPVADLATFAEAHGLRRRRRRHHDWRRRSGGLLVGLVHGEEATRLYAQALAVLDYFGESHDLDLGVNRTAWVSPSLAELGADWTQTASALLASACDEDWVYCQLRRSVEKRAEPQTAEQLLIWAATLERGQDAEYAADRWLLLWEPWMAKWPDNIWTSIAEVHERLGNFRLPPQPGAA